MKRVGRVRRRSSAESVAGRRRRPRPARRKGLKDPAVLALFVSNLQEGVYITLPDGEIVDANPAFLAMLGVASLAELGSYTAEHLLVDPARRAAELDILAREGAVREFELEVRRPDGGVRTVLDTAYQVVDPDTGEKSFHGILVDISDRKELERQLFQAALRDPLTGCYNRRYIMDREHDIERPDQTWGAIVIDIDHFKQYNDLHGHATGDRVLVRVARFLRSMSRPEDAVVRIGGDEFLLLLASDAAGATGTVAGRLKEASAEGVPVSLSYGWAVRRDGERLEETIQRADQSLLAGRARARGPARSRRRVPQGL